MIGNYSFERVDLRDVLAANKVVRSCQEISAFYNDFYLGNLKKLLKHKYIKPGWYKIDDIQVTKKKEAREFTDSRTDSYLMSMPDKRELAHDIMSVGTFWPLTVIHTNEYPNQVFKGSHRVVSAKLVQADGEWDERKMFAIELTEAVENSPWEFYSRDRLLDGDNKYFVPITILYPDYYRTDTVCDEVRNEISLHGGRIINGDIVEIPILNYRCLLKMMTYFTIWLSELNYTSKSLTGESIRPSLVINSEEEFNLWYNN